MATPASHLSAHELLQLGNTGREVPLLNKFWPEIVGTFFGVGTGVFLNFQTRRPIFSGKSRLHNGDQRKQHAYFY